MEVDITFTSFHYSEHGKGLKDTWRKD